MKESEDITIEKYYNDDIASIKDGVTENLVSLKAIVVSVDEYPRYKFLIEEPGKITKVLSGAIKDTTEITDFKEIEEFEKEIMDQTDEGEKEEELKINDQIKLSLSQTVSSDYVKSIIKIEIEYEEEISNIKIVNEEIKVPDKKDGKYTIEKEINTNGIIDVIVKDKEGKYQKGSINVSEITEDMNIYTLEDLVKFRDKTSQGATYEGKTIKVMNDIDLSTVCGENIGNWVPISTFKGTFDGNHHTIANLYISGTSSCQGLFEYTIGEVRNIRLEQVNIEGNTEVGSIAGKNEGRITECYVKGTLKGYRGGIGGIVGRNSGDISQCVSDVKMVLEASSVDNGQYGGIVGGLTGGMIELCYNLGDIEIKSGSNVGGIVGWAGRSSIIRNSYNIGEITGSATNVGGILGSFGIPSLGTKIENCYNMTNIIGKTNVGNIIGYFASDDAEIRNSYYLKNTKGGYGYNSGQICETIEKEEKDLKNSAQLLGDAFTHDVQNEDGMWKYNNGYPILKWQLDY